VLLENFLFLGQIGVADLFDVWAFIPTGTEEAQNTTNVGNFSTFPRMDIAPDFGIVQRNSKPWKPGWENGRS
jgi:hypothetical protein